ncbi:double zinc ribbon domain-containing protein [Plastorhodobacter daqingensis]|uniref:Double zinc ribbon domain-containing protein n=1 Tax=Plastorhodobacter daqingensis TaxID=1387281 RepID=A0ABW2UFD1_9RHOB
MQSVLRAIYPPQCLSCRAHVTSEFGLCGTCWRDTPFVAGLCCDQCGMPLPGEDEGTPVHCDDCLDRPRPWLRGRAAMLYAGNGRRIVLSLKHGDRLDVGRAAAEWLARAAAPMLQSDMIVAPIPLHWLRLLRRRYNQAALLSRGVAARTGLAHCPDLLVRPRATRSLDGRGRDERFATLEGALAVHPRRRHLLVGRHVLLVDDVMTSGATFHAGAEACRAAGAAAVSVLALARVAKGS